MTTNTINASENFFLQKIELFTNFDGKAAFKTREVNMVQQTPQLALSTLVHSNGYQWRYSPVGFRSEFHCTQIPQWLFVLSGAMQIKLQNGDFRIFRSGECFYSNDTLPVGEVFNPNHHGHSSCQIGVEALVTLFVQSP